MLKIENSATIVGSLLADTLHNMRKINLSWYKVYYCFFAILFFWYFACVIYANDNTTEIKVDTSLNLDSFYITPPPYSFVADPEIVLPKRYSWKRSCALSAVLPGAGQFYCESPLKGTSFLTATIISALVAQNRITNYQNEINKTKQFYYIKMKDYKDSLNFFTSNFDLYRKYYTFYILTAMRYELEDYDYSSEKTSAMLNVSWLVGIYVWNIADALSCSNSFYDIKPRRPYKAAILGSIPFLGLGQIYNRSFSKAGLIFTTHTMFALSAYNYHRQLEQCHEKIVKVRNTVSISSSKTGYYVHEWESKKNRAFKRRNFYIWYFVIFYFYGLFDAVVDAHFHDYQHKIRLEPVSWDWTHQKFKGISLHIAF